MAEHFFALPKTDQAALLRLRAEQLRMQPFVLEKDIWVCWALDKLFKMPGRLPMAFKGGTSLSKVYRVIDRFSEDIDVTLDYRGFVHNSQVLGNISGERHGQLFIRDVCFTVLRKVNQRLGQRELIRGDVAPEEDNSAPVILQRWVLFLK